MTEIIVKPFDWNDNFSEVAQEDFFADTEKSAIRNGFFDRNGTCKVGTFGKAGM